MLGGQALAEILFGGHNPSGRLTISFPYHVGQQPIFYSQVRGQHGDRYADLTKEPGFAFGEGLSYTKFTYSTPTLAKSILTNEEQLEVTLEVTNTGDREGIEIVRVYISDLVTSATWVDRELKAFKRVYLEAGESKLVKLEIPVVKRSIIDVDGARVVEAGDFELLIGCSSRPKDLQRSRFTIS